MTSWVINNLVTIFFFSIFGGRGKTVLRLVYIGKCFKEIYTIMKNYLKISG